MVARQPVIGAGVGIASYEATRRMPQVLDNQQAQDGLTALAGLGAIVASTQVENPSAKTAMVAAGTGIIGGTASGYVPFLEG